MAKDMYSRHHRSLAKGRIKWRERVTVPMIERLTDEPFRRESVLYVGAVSRVFTFGTRLFLRHAKVTILEVYKPNVERLKKLKWLDGVIEGDVRTWKPGRRKWDTVIWCHGPEHVTDEELPGVLEKLERVSRRLVILVCPCGETHVRPDHQNEFMQHVGAVFPEKLEELGYKVTDQEMDGGKPVRTIVAVKEMT